VRRCPPTNGAATARVEEAQTEARDVYALVYDADRPELFMKDAHMLRTVGPGGPIRVRSDSSWMVPEPELALVLGEGGEPVAVTIGNDVSSRDIEGTNPLYLPQAKIFAGACALGPALAVPDDWDAPFPIRLRILDSDGSELFAGETSNRAHEAQPARASPGGSCATTLSRPAPCCSRHRLVPPDDYTLRPGHTVEIEIEGIGVLSNTVAE